MAAFPYTYTPTEEIVRWAFEVHVNSNDTAKKNWFIAFTNPTAGPWKRVTAPDTNGVTVEIARFAREEERPDLVLVSDSLHTTLIVEAKDDLSKLIGPIQMQKSLNVIRDLGNRLRTCPVTAWGKRAKYNIVPGFLWGGSNPDNEIKQVLTAYDEYSEPRDGISVVGVAVVKTHGSLHPVMVGRADDVVTVSHIAQSFDLLRK